MDKILVLIKFIFHGTFIVLFIAKLLMNIRCVSRRGKKTSKRISGTSLMPGVEIILIPLLIISNPIVSPKYGFDEIFKIAASAMIVSYVPLCWVNIRKQGGR